MNRVRSLLEEIGLGGERVRMVNLSAAMGARFAEIAAEMVEKIKALGPNPVDGRPPAPAGRGRQGRVFPVYRLPDMEVKDDCC